MKGRTLLSLRVCVCVCVCVCVVLARVSIDTLYIRMSVCVCAHVCICLCVQLCMRVFYTTAQKCINMIYDDASTSHAEIRTYFHQFQNMKVDIY